MYQYSMNKITDVSKGLLVLSSVIHSNTLRVAISLALLFVAVPGRAVAEEQLPPDFSGLWMPSRDTVSFPSDLPYTDWAQGQLDGFAAEFDKYLDDPKRFCVLPGMPGSVMFRAPFPLEVIQREQDLTLFFEGYYQYRKIYIKGFEPDLPPLRTRMGFSVGEWEGDTLVVKTINLKQRAQGSEILSEQAEITERINIETDKDGNKQLAFYLELADPLTYTKSIKGVGRWGWSPDMHIMEYVCSETIYEEHLERVRAEQATSK